MRDDNPSLDWRRGVKEKLFVLPSQEYAATGPAFSGKPLVKGPYNSLDACTMCS
jgi:hypothetical protein